MTVTILARCVYFSRRVWPDVYGEVLGINQPKISALMNVRLEGFSMERLIHFLNCLDQDVKILITKKTKRRKNHGKLEVVFA